jgi:hypothetical protein
MARDPFRRPPAIDIPWGERERWWDRMTRKLTESSRWHQAESLADLGELVAQFCEGKLLATPGHDGPRDPETREIAGPLAHANRQGFVTSNSQPGCARRGEGYEDGYEQRAEVTGWATPATAEKLQRLFAGTRIQVRAVTDRPRRASYDNAVNVSRSVMPEGTWEHTVTGFVPGRSTRFIDLGRPDLIEGAAWVTVYDPEWGNHSLLWDRLSQPDWDHPEPPEPEPTMTTTRIPTDAEVDHLSGAVDRAFAERDRLDDVARRTGRDDDLAAMLRQDEHAARLLDQYNAAVAAQMAESDRQRAENVHRYAEQERQRRHEQESLWRELCAAEYKIQVRQGGNDGHPSDDLDTLTSEARASALADQLSRDVGISARALRRRAQSAAYDHGQDPGTDYDPDRFAPPDWEAARGEEVVGGGNEGADASSARLDPPPAAEAYKPRHLEIKRTGRWYDTDPIKSTNTTPTGGTGMSIGDARQDMLGPIEKLNEALGLMQAGNAALEEAQTGLQQATEGSNQAEADQANAQVTESKNKIDEAQQQIAQALQEFEGVAQRL